MEVKDLEAKVVELRKDLMTEYMQISMGTQLKNPRLVRAKKKTIARLLTALKEKQAKEDNKSAEEKSVEEKSAEKNQQKKEGGKSKA